MYQNPYASFENVLDRYVEQILAVLQHNPHDCDNKEKSSTLLNLYEQMWLYYENLPENFRYDFTKLSRCPYQSFVIPSTPILKEESPKKVYQIYRKLLLKEDLLEGEDETFLNWIVFCTRIHLHQYLQTISYSEEVKDIKENSLEGLCGLASYMIVKAFSHFPWYVSSYDHADITDTLSHIFVILKLPICKDGIRKIKEYVIDCTYRQFFTSASCSKGNLYRGLCPDDGYYMMMEEKSSLFAQKLLEKGYFELTEEQAKMYFDGHILGTEGKRIYDFDKNKQSLPISYTGSDYMIMLKSAKPFTLLEEGLIQDLSVSYFQTGHMQKILQYAKKISGKNRC